MRAFTKAEAVQLAFAEVSERDRRRPELRKFYVRADKIRNADGWGSVVVAAGTSERQPGVPDGCT